MVSTSTRLLLGLLAGLAVALGVEPAAAAEPADLSVRVTSRSFRNGETGLFMVLVTNRGRNATDAPVHLDLDLPDGLTYVTGGGVGFDCSATASGVGCVRAAPFPSRTTVTVRVYVDV